MSKPGLFGRSCAALVSDVDRAESGNCGAAAVRAAVKGHTGQMVAIRRLQANLAPTVKWFRRECGDLQREQATEKPLFELSATVVNRYLEMKQRQML